MYAEGSPLTAGKTYSVRASGGFWCEVRDDSSRHAPYLHSHADVVAENAQATSRSRPQQPK
jgi:hypothetical protein